MADLTVLERTPEGTAVRGGVRDAFELKGNGDRTSASVMEISHQTGLVLMSSSDSVVVQDARDSYKTVFSSPMKHVVGLDVSPLGNFLVTYQRPIKDQPNEKNLKVFALRSQDRDESGNPTEVYAQPQKQASQDMWPLYQFDQNEEHMYRSVANEVHAIKTAAYGDGIAKKLRVKGLNTFAISKGPEPKVAVYCPESKGAPGSVQIFDLETDFSSESKSNPQPSARRSFYRSSRAKLMWNASGKALLAWAFSDVDKTNQNYFGEQSLHFLSADGDREQLVELKDGPIHDVKWAPNGQHFVAIHGFMPAKATLFDHKCKPIYDFGSGPRNTVEWSPFSRFLVIGGFGNLPGDIEFYDKKADGKCKVMGKVRAACTVNCGWAPDGRHLITSTTSPRLRVDNGFKVFHYNGDLVHEQKVDVLLQVDFGPSPPDLYQDRPASPDKVKKSLAKAASGGSSGSRPAAYVPPHLKNKGGGGSRSNFSLAYDKTEKGPGKIKSQPGGRSSSNLPPGAELAQSKSAAKNAKRRAKKKAAAAAAAAGQ
ncbi:eukaryotic translation initiation factor 2A [Chloropicon primus]|uniref:Eukaryotic translation initiation factor 2A n=1 Tax=Chloropicon primus TaxID=1764295 RepID=A0A5B8MJZ6_9CHLO|nr:eukaryotic translation initiation factor 2A [Chloropicon primus]UPQ99613.1 eukaryotic translation initiation factor 2A [Chloropicon primus]|eukprot:QDZ20404.1 eukaryotic translation initiation factor 2A [Chloropicon primus]